MRDRLPFTTLLICSVVTFLSLSSSRLAIAQVATATVQGTLEDASGARIEHGIIRLVNTATGAENIMHTGDYGYFLLAGLFPGTYLMEVERDGFAPFRFTGITLNVGDTKAFRIRMKIGTALDSVLIDASGSTVSREDASVSTIVGRQFVTRIPLNGRSFQDLIAMTPGTVGQTPQSQTSGDFSVNGQRPDTNVYLVDGVSANIGPGDLTNVVKVPSAGQFVGSTALGTTQGLISIDALQEFRVLGSTYSAEYGRTPGGQFTLSSRSGSSTPHGTAYAYLRNSYFDAGDWFGGINGLGRGVYFYQQDIGGTLGVHLPLPTTTVHSSPFLFASYEELHVRQPLPPVITYSPNWTLRRDAAPSIRPVLNAFPLAISVGDYGSNVGPPPNLAIASVARLSPPSFSRTMSYRADQAITSKLNGFLRYGATSSSSQTHQQSAVTDITLKSVTITAGLNYQIAPRVNNETYLGYARTSSHLNTGLEEFSGGVPVDLNSALSTSRIADTSSVEFYSRLDGTGEASVNSDQAANHLSQWNLRDTALYETHGHLFKIGFDERSVLSDVRPAATLVQASFLKLDALMSGVASDALVKRSLPADPWFQELSLFIEDAWKVGNRVSASFGVRWEIDPPPTGRGQGDAFTSLPNSSVVSSIVLAPRGTPLWTTDKSALAPRAGFAWTIREKDGQELVLRAGGGMFYDTPYQAAAPAFSAAGFSSATHSTEAALPLSGLIVPSDAALSSGSGALVYSFPKNMKLPFTSQWNASMEKGLGKHQSVSLSYVGSQAQRLLLPHRSVPMSMEGASQGELVSFPTGGHAGYHSLQAKFQRTITPGLTLLGSYVWSHSIDTASVSPLLPFRRGNADLDLRNNVQVGFSWNQPKFEGNAVMRNAFNGWGFDGRYFSRSAYPITPLGRLKIDQFTGERFYGEVNAVPGRPLYRFDRTTPGQRLFNGGPGTMDPAFVLPQDQVGNAPRNQLRGFGAQQLNLAIRREIHLFSALSLQLRAESFNVTNSVDFGFIPPHLTDQLFGQPTLILGQSFGQNGSLYQPGGPRSLQWMFRVSF